METESSRPATADEPPARRAASEGKRGPADSALARAASIGWRVTVIGVAVVLIGYLVGVLENILIPLLIAALLAALVRPAVDRLDQRGLPRWLAVLVPVGGLTLFLAGIIFLVVFSLKSESAGLERSVAIGIDQLRALFDAAQERLGNGTLNGLDGALTAEADRIPALVGQLALGLVAGLFEIGLAVVFCYFFLLDEKNLSSSIQSRIAPASYRRIASVFEQTRKRIELYVRGIAITALANALMFGGALSLIGVPLIGTNMVITFIGSFIPYVGPVTATAVASLLALGNNGWVDALLVVGAGALVQAIEGNLLHPIVVGRTTHASPFVIVLSVSTGAALAGLIGALVAVPVVLVSVLVFDATRESSPDPLLRKSNTEPVA